MADKVDHLLKEFDRGELNRRQLIKGLAYAAAGAMLSQIGQAEVAAAAATAAAPSAPPIVPVLSFNHINLGVKDSKRSAEFYASIYGGKLSDGGTNLVTLPGGRAGYGSWISLVEGNDPRPMMDHSMGKPGLCTHIGIGTTVSEKEFPRIAMEVEKRFPDLDWTRRPTLPMTGQAGREIYIFDPDGFPIQLIDVGFNGWGNPTEPAEKRGPLAAAMSINHIHIEVSDLKKAAEFYSVVYGAKPAAGGPNIQTLILPSAKKGFGSWLSLTSAGGGASRKETDGTDGKPGQVSHVGFGVKIPIKDFPRIAKEVKKRFPEVKMPTTPITEQAGQEIYIFDPDGFPIQLIPIEFNAW